MRRDVRKVLPPGPRMPAALQLLGIWTRPTGSLLRLRRYGRRATVRLPFQPPTVILSDPGDIRDLFQAPADAIHPGEGARILEPIVGPHSVILLDEADHLSQRRLLLPAFHGERMRALRDTMTELSEEEVGSWPTGQPVALHPRLQRVTLNIILRAVFGLERGPALDALRDLVGELLSFSESPLSLVPPLAQALSWTKRQRRFEQVLRETDERIFALIEERRRSQAAGEPDREDILSTLLAARHESDEPGQEGEPMSRQELRDELVTALVAGHETTASQLAWALERLAREPQIQTRLSDEAAAGDGDSYLTATINEILRLRPVLPSPEPRLTKREVQIGAHRYPAGVVLIASAVLLHHDPELYPDPSAFRPERFLDQAPGTYTWIPFGGGRRRCLGASFAIEEMKIVLRAVLGRWRLEPAGDRPETSRRRSITLSPSGSATVVLRPAVAAPTAQPLAA